MNWGKLFEVLTDIVNLVLDAVAFAKSDPSFAKDWNELMSDVMSLTGLAETVDAPVAEEASERDFVSPDEQPFVAPDGSLYPTEAQWKAAVERDSQPTVRRLSKSGGA